MDPLSKLQEDMKNPDPHFRQNAVIAYGKYFEVEEARNKLKEEEKANIVKQLLERLKPAEYSLEVKGRTVKVFKNIAIYLKEAEIIQVFSVIVNYITDPNAKGKDIFVDCIKNILDKVPGSFFETIGKVIIPVLSKGLDVSDQEVLILSIDTLNGYIKKFDYMLLKEKYSSFKLDTKKYVKVCLKNICSSNETLRTKSVEFLETVGELLDRKEISESTATILDLFNKAKSINDKKNYIVAMKSLAETSSSKQKEYVPKIVKLFTPYITREFLDNDPSEYDDKNTFVEAGLNCLSIYISNALSQMNDYMDGIIKNCIKLIEYDPNYSYEGGNEDINLEDYGNYEDIGYDANLDDSSWVVRRAASRTLKTILNSGYNMEKDSKEKIIDQLIQCLREHEENTKIEIIDCLMQYLNSLVVVGEKESKLTLMKKQSSLVNEYIPKVANGLIEKILTDLKGKSDAIISYVLKLLPVIALIIPKQIIDIFSKVKEGIDAACFKSNENTIILMDFLTKLFEADDFDEDYMNIYKDVIGYIKKGLNNGYYKVSSAAITSCSFLFKILSQEIEKNKEYILSLYKDIFPKFQTQDIDYEIKVASIDAMSVFIIECGTLINEKEIKTLFSIFEAKSGNELLRPNVLVSLNNIVKNDKKLPLDNSIKELKNMILKILSSAPTQVQSKALLLLESIFKNYPNALKDSINDITKHLFEIKNQESLMPFIFNVFKNMLPLPDSTIKSIFSYIEHKLTELTIEKNYLTSLYEFTRSACTKFSQKELKALTKKYSSQIKSLNDNFSYFVSILFCFSGEEKPIVDTAINCLGSAKDNKERISVLLFLGNICENSKENHDELIGKLESFKQKSDANVNEYISKTIGKVGANNPKSFINNIISIKQNQDALISLYEFLTLCENKNKDIGDKDIASLINWLLKAPELNNEYNNKLVGLSIGLLIRNNHKFIDNYIKLINENKGDKKSSLLNGIKDIFKSKKKLSLEHLNALVNIAVEGIKNKERLVKEYSMQGLNSLQIVYQSKLVNLYNDAEIRKLIHTSCEIDKNYIKEADFGGGNKITEDKGIEIRKAALGIVTFIIEQFPNKVNYQESVPLLINCLLDTEDFLQSIVYSDLTKLAHLNSNSFSPYAKVFIDTLFKVYKRIRIDETKKLFRVNVKKLLDELKDVQSITSIPDYKKVVEEINKK